VIEVVELIVVVVEGPMTRSLSVFFLLLPHWRGGGEVCLVRTTGDVGFEAGGAGLELVLPAEHGCE